MKNDDSINDMTTETLYGKLILTLKKFTGLKGRKILDLLNDDVNESLAKEIYSAIHLFSYVILNDPTNIIQLLNGCIFSFPLIFYIDFLQIDLSFFNFQTFLFHL